MEPKILQYFHTPTRVGWCPCWDWSKLFPLVTSSNNLCSMWKVLFHWVSTSWITLSCGLPICSCTSVSLFLKSKLAVNWIVIAAATQTKQHQRNCNEVKKRTFAVVLLLKWLTIFLTLDPMSHRTGFWSSAFFTTRFSVWATQMVQHRWGSLAHAPKLVAPSEACQFVSDSPLHHEWGFHLCQIFSCMGLTDIQYSPQKQHLRSCCHL